MRSVPDCVFRCVKGNLLSILERRPFLLRAPCESKTRSSVYLHSTFDDLGNSEVWSFGLRRLFENFSSDVTIANNVIAQRSFGPSVRFQHLRHRLDARDVQLLQFVDVAEDAIKLHAKLLDFRFT